MALSSPCDAERQMSGERMERGGKNDENFTRLARNGHVFMSANKKRVGGGRLSESLTSQFSVCVACMSWIFFETRMDQCREIFS
jgi:hypothetical protein